MTFHYVDKEEEENRKLSDGDQSAKKSNFRPAGVERNIMSAEVPHGYVGRWVLDYPPGNITRRINQGYDFLIDESLSVGAEDHIDGHRVPGNVVCKYGNPRHKDLQYLMIIPKEQHEKLVESNQQVVDQIDKQLYGREGDGQYTAPESRRDEGLARHQKQ